MTSFCPVGLLSARLCSWPCRYVVLFFYPKDFTFVCPTEIIAFSDRSDEFNDLNCQVIGASTDTPEVVAKPTCLECTLLLTQLACYHDTT